MRDVAPKHILLGLGGALSAAGSAVALEMIFHSATVRVVIMSGLIWTLVTFVLHHAYKVKQLERDSLTECYQRYVAERWMERVSKRHREVTLVVVDVNGLKKVNDSHGHDVGDELIREVSDRLMSAFGHKLRRKSMVARLHGDEFLIICERAVDPEQMALEIHDLLGAPHKWGDWAIATAGVSRSVNGDTRYAMKCADLAMYRAKTLFYAGGATETVVYDSDVDGQPPHLTTRGSSARDKRRRLAS